MTRTTVSHGLVPYEVALDAQPEFALLEGSRHFDERSAVHQSLQNICRRLTESRISYVVVGGMALFRHGFRRFTEDVDILVSRTDLRRIHEELEGRGYVPVFTGSKNLRDTATQVKIEFLIEGDYPGDGKPKPVAFPRPEDVAFEENGVRYLNLPTLIELKLASGMSSAERIKDLADVQELIRLLQLPSDFSDQLNPYVRDKYHELWRSIMGSAKRYYRMWRNKFLTVDAAGLPEMIQTLRAAADQLQAMLDDGVVRDPQGGTGDDYAYLMTTDPAIARKYDMHEESEFFGLEDEQPPVP